MRNKIQAFFPSLFPHVFVRKKLFLISLLAAESLEIWLNLIDSISLGRLFQSYITFIT